MQALPSNVLPGDVGGPESYLLKLGADYQLGSSMVFIREPRNLFNMEYMRTLALGKVSRARANHHRERARVTMHPAA